MPSPAVTSDQFHTFGELLRFLRHRAGLTQRALSMAVGYSESQISRMEKNERAPDKSVLAARFVPALDLQNERVWTARLLALAAASHAADHTLPPETIKPPRHNLPLQLTSFIGREKEILQVKQLLSANRLATLTGAGGCGKTRLALQAASQMLDAFADGVRWVELAALADESLVPQAIAQTLGVREVPNEPLSETLASVLRSKQLLLVLDNCEHLITACAQLAERLLQACPDLKILATSREPFAIAGETVYQVPSLSLPHRNHTPTRLLESEAVRLFVERARAVKPDLSLTPQNARAVVQICQRLDGMPLALELAAARVKVLTVEHIAARLDDRFNLLTTGTRTALPRHQTLRAAIDWSYDLLPEEARRLFRRLAVFAGGFTLEAAEFVCSRQEAESSMQEAVPKPRLSNTKQDAPPSAYRRPNSVWELPTEVLDPLSRLVDRSLVIVDVAHDDERYHMLETIRQYAGEELAESGEDKAVRDRHLAYFTRLAEAGEVKLKSAERPVWTNRLETELDNLRAALEWSLASDVAQGFRVVRAMLRFWLVRGYFTEGRDWAKRVLAHSDQVPAALKIKALNTAGALAYFQYDSTAQALLEESVALSEAIGDKQLLADALGWLAGIFQLRGDFDKAESLGEKCMGLYRVTGDDWDLADQLHGHSWLMIRRGDYARGRALNEESLMLFNQTGDRWIKASPLSNLGWIAYSQGDYASARKLCEESLALFREVGDTNGCALVTNWLGEIARAMGDNGRAVANYQESIALTPLDADVALASKRSGLASKRANLGFAVLHQDDDARALELFRDSLSIARKSDDKYTIAICLIGFAGVALVRQQAERAGRLLAVSEALLESSSLELEPADRIEYESSLAALRAQINDQAFAAAWAEGQTLAVEQAIEYALALPSEQAAPPPSQRDAAKSAFGGLTPRERDVAARIAQGESNREIARELVVSERTVETHVTNILNKLRFTSRAEIRKWAIEKGLVKHE